MEYWRSRAIFSIIKGLDTPLSLDENTMRKKRGIFARVLVNIDMLSLLLDHLLVERSDYTFVVGVEYEWLPPFCSHCKMIWHELAQCRVIHDQGCVPESQQKSSQKIVSDEPNNGRIVAPKQRQEYRKKDPQPKLVEGPTDNSNFVVPGEANSGSPLGHLASDKPGGLEDDFADMPPLENASDHKSRKGLSTHTSDFSKQGMLPIVIECKGLEFHAPIEVLHVEVSPPVGDLSLQRATSLVVSTTPFTTPMDGHHMSAIVTVPSPSLVLQNHFSSLEGLETTDVGGDPYVGTSTTIVEFNYDHITIENHIGSKFWADPNEMEEDASDIGEEITRTKRKPGRQPKGTSKAKKTAKTVLTITSQ